MKRERISLFVLVAEIAAITLLHSAKTNQSELEKQQLAKGKTAVTSYQLKTTNPLIKLK